METSDRGTVALRVSTTLVLAATMFGLLVWYGSIAGGLSIATSVLDVLPDLAESLAPIAGTLPTSLVAPALPASFVGGASSLGGASPALSTTALADLLAAPLSSDRAHWEVQYMYGVSALAGAWVLVRLCLGWRFDRRLLGIVPRSRSEERDA